MKWTWLTILAIFCCYFIMGWPISKGIHYITGVAALFVPIIIFSKPRFISIIVSLFLSTIIALEFAYYITFSERVSPAVLSAAQTVTVDMAYKVTEPILKIFIPVFFVFSLLSIASGREISRLSIKKRLIALFACIFLPCLTLGLASYKVIKDSLVPEVTTIFIKDAPIDFLKNMVYMRYPLVMGDTSYILGDLYRLNKIKNMPPRAQLYKGVSFPSNANKHSITKIILVIGESSLSDRYSIYGYPFNTTPNLTKLLQQKIINKVDHVISPAAVTRDSLMLTLSFATPSNLEVFYQKQNIIDMAKKAGYQTVWLSATTEKGLTASYLDLLSSSSQIMLDSNSLRVSNLQKNKPEDLVLLPLLKENLKKEEKQLIILHLEGSHMNYKDRYDKVDEQLVTTNADTDYDRTIHHTDRVVNEVIKQLEGYEDVVVFYFADHGEVVNKSHGLIFASDEQYKIPFLYYQSKKNNYTLAKDIEKYRSDNGYFNLMNIKYIISELMNYKIDPLLIEKAKAEGETVFHPDQKVYKFLDVQSSKMPVR